MPGGGGHHCRDRDRMVVGFTKVVSSNPAHARCTQYSHYAIEFVSDLRQVSGFPWVLWFPPPIKLTATI